MSAWPPEGTVKVLMTPEVMEQMWSRDHLGRRVTIDWGEPDEAGFHEPTLSVALDDPAAQDLADGQALRLLREALAGKDAFVRVYTPEGSHDLHEAKVIGPYSDPMWVGAGVTLADAADKAREALKS